MICPGQRNQSLKELAFPPYNSQYNRKCEFKNKDVVNLRETEIFEDFSFWIGEGRCINYDGQQAYEDYGHGGVTTQKW